MKNNKKSETLVCQIGTIPCGSSCCNADMETCSDGFCVNRDETLCNGEICSGACCNNAEGNGNICCPNLNNNNECPVTGGCECGFGTFTCGSNCCNPDTEKCSDGFCY